MPGDRLTIGISSGSTHDSVYPGNATDASIGPILTQADTDFDIAVEVGTDIHVQRGVGFGIFVRVGSSTRIRASWYCQGGTNGGFSNLVRTEYSVSSTDGSTYTESSGTNANTGNLFEGGPSWFRLRRVGSVWTSFISGDGTTWLTERSWTAAISGVTGIKLGLMNTTTTAPAKSFDVFRVIDVAATPDPRPTWVKTVHTNVQSTDFSSGALPSWLTSTVNASGAISFPGSPARLRMSHAAATNRSAATVAYNGSASLDQGLLVKIEIPGGTVAGQPFFDPGVVSNGLGAGVVDQYSLAGGNSYIIEMPGGTFDGSHVRAVRRTASPDAYTNYSMATTAGNGFESAYTHMLGDAITSSLNFSLAFWLRLEYADGRYRSKWWQDGSAEPGTWMWDGLDRISRGTGGVQSMNWAHNDGATATVATDSVDIRYAEIYNLAAPASGATVGYRSGGTFTAKPLQLRVAGAWT